MRRYFVVSLLCLLPVWTASADTFSFAYTGSLYSGSGTLTAVNNGNGSFTATSGSGFYDGFAISLIPDPSAPSFAISSSGAFYYDNGLLPAQNPVIDSGGLLFSINGLGATELNFCSNGLGCGTTGGYASLLNNGHYNSDGVTDSGKFTLTNVPEPSTLAWLGLSLLGLTMIRRQSLAGLGLESGRRNPARLGPRSLN
ncbi:MAG: PEP-CTERM sorting domain-containing protein [Acidobacteriia bacterium]|nr:PEP-CTERM sorting domain-containing protein [Terriglobia bacterium]